MRYLIPEFVPHAGVSSVGVARLVAFGFLAIGLAGPAAASVLPIAGAYGNEAGCAFFLHGETGAGMALLTGESFASPAGGCDLVSFVSAANGEFVAEAACDGIGRIHEGLDRVTVRDGGDAGFFVMIEKAEVAGPLLPCPGAAEALSPGVRI